MNEDELNEKDEEEEEEEEEEEGQQEGTRDMRDRISDGTYKANRKKQNQLRRGRFAGLNDDQIRQKIAEEDAQRAKDAEDERLDQDPELNKQREDVKQGDFLQDPEEYNPYRLGASITTEIGLNLLLDVFSAAPPVQAVGSAWINYLAQKIRGETDINKLEMTAASIASQIPLLGSFKGATKAGKFGKGVVEGSVTGVIEETGYSLGRGEEANVPEAALFGATVGGIFNSRNAPDFFDSIKGKLTKNKPLVTPEGMTFESPTVLATTSSGTGSSKPSIKVPAPTNENQSDYFRRLKTDMQFKSKATTIGKLADQDEALEIAENLLKHVDEGERGLIPGWVAGRPTTKYRGKRLLDYTRPDGTPSQLYFNYSASNNSIVAIDYLKRMQTKLSREKWNVNSNSSLGQIADDIWKSARRKNRELRIVLQDLQTTNPEEFSKIFGTKGVWYVEHLHAQNSPFWDKVRPFSARDPINLMALGEQNFPKLKTNIENHMYTGRWQGGAFKKYGTRVYLDYNPKDKTLQLKRADNDEPLGAIIDGDTPQRNWQKALRDAEANIPQGDISNVNPDLDPIVDYTDKITATTAARIPDVGTQPGIAKTNIPLNLSKEAQEKIDGYQAEIDQARKNIDLYNSQFTAVPIKEGVPSLGSKIKKTKSLTSLPLNGPNSVNSNKQIIADRLQEIQKLQAEAQGSLLDSKPGVTQSTGTGLMTNVQEEVPAVKQDTKVKPKKVKRTKQQEAIEDENPLL